MLKWQSWARSQGSCQLQAGNLRLAESWQSSRQLLIYCSSSTEHLPVLAWLSCWHRPMQSIPLCICNTSGHWKSKRFFTALCGTHDCLRWGGFFFLIKKIQYHPTSTCTCTWYSCDSLESQYILKPRWSVVQIDLCSNLCLANIQWLVLSRSLQFQ